MLTVRLFVGLVALGATLSTGCSQHYWSVCYGKNGVVNVPVPVTAAPPAPTFQPVGGLTLPHPTIPSLPVLPMPRTSNTTYELVIPAAPKAIKSDGNCSD